MLAMVVVVKFVVWGSVVWLFRFSISTAIVVAAGLTQIGELSFILAQTARSAGLVGENVFSTLIAASLLSILLNVFPVSYTHLDVYKRQLRELVFASPPPRRSAAPSIVPALPAAARTPWR